MARTPSHPRTCTAVGRLLAAAAVVIGLSAPAGAAVAQGQVSPAEAPRAWIDFAGVVQSRLTEWLQGEDEAAVELRERLEASRPDPDSASVPVVLKVWLDEAGAITRVEAPSLVDEAAVQGVRSLLVGRAVGAQPPQGMRLPLNLAVQLEPAPEAEPEAAQS